MMEITRIDALRIAINSSFEEGGDVFVCRGQPLCEENPHTLVDYCNWCYVILASDRRPLEEIDQAIEGQHRGH